MSDLRNAIREGEMRRIREEQELARIISQENLQHRNLEAENNLTRERKIQTSWGYFQKEIMPHIREIASVKNIPLRTYKSGIVAEIFGNSHGILPSKPGFESGCYYDPNLSRAFSSGELVWDVKWEGDHGSWQKLAISVDDAGVVSGIGDSGIYLASPTGRSDLLTTLVTVMKNNGYYDSWTSSQSFGEGH